MLAVSGNDDAVHEFILGQVSVGDGNNADAAVDIPLRIVVDHGPVQGPGKVLGRSGLHQLGIMLGPVQSHVGNVVLGDQADQLSVFIHHAQGLFPGLPDDVAGFQDSGIRRNGNGSVDLNFRQAYPGIVQKHGLLKAEPFQKEFCLHAQLAQTAGNGPDSVGSFIKGVSDRGSDGIRIRVLVPCDINCILYHVTPPYIGLAFHLYFINFRPFFQCPFKAGKT